MHNHSLALHAADLAGRHLETLRHGGDTLLLDLKVIQRIRQCDAGSLDFLPRTREIEPWAKELGTVSPVIHFVDIRVEAFLFFQRRLPIRDTRC